MRDYYCKVLGVSPTASEAEIKSAYRKLVARAHPDVNGNSRESTERFMKIQAAYEALSQNSFPSSAPRRPAGPRPSAPRRPAPATAPMRRRPSPVNMNMAPPPRPESNDFIDELFETFSRDVESAVSSFGSFFRRKKKKR